MTPKFRALGVSPDASKLLYLDAGSGLAGDMIVAALIDLGVPLEILQAGLRGLGVSGYELRVHTVQRSGLSAKRFDVQVEKRQPPRNYAQIVALIERAKTLSDGARRLALDAFTRLADAEARVHGSTRAKVHFHEVGAVDSIVDIVAAAIAFDHLRCPVVCSPLPMGRGFTQSEHGVLPLPAPATVLCLADAPTYDAGSDGEFVTPTGACLAASVSQSFGGWPAFRPERVGLGAGTKEFPGRTNVLRVVLGTPAAKTTSSATSGAYVQIETNVDDTTAEVASHALAAAFEAGALDAWSVAIGMKKSRPGWTLAAIAPSDKLEGVARALLAETTSLGVRYHAIDRIERPRQLTSVRTRFGEIAIKVAGGDGLPETAAPEYEACRAAARTHAVPIREVYAAASLAYARKTPKKQRSRAR
jgi:hypothetical protein